MQRDLLPVEREFKEKIYNLDYYEKILVKNSATARIINSIRWQFIREIHPKVVLDYGSGAGWFRAFSPSSVVVDTYDLMDTPQTGVNHDYYDLITMWDVLEHLPDFSVLDGLKTTDYFAVTVPIKPDTTRLSNWIHYKPGEHLHYFTEESLKEFFNNRGFILLKDGYPEVECGVRKDIYSAIFKKE